MAMFKNALVRLPCRNMVHGLSTAGLGRPDYKKALDQHDAYVAALQGCGLAVTVMAADENYPDSVFIEDTAVLSEKAAIITRSGASSRRGEEVAVAEALSRFYDHLEYITAPGTLDGGMCCAPGISFLQEFQQEPMGRGPDNWPLFWLKMIIQQPWCRCAMSCT